MTFKLVFKQAAKKEWDRLDATVRSIFVKKLKKILAQPGVEKLQLNGMKNCCKIKLRQAGYRLVYQIRDKELIVAVIAVGKREKNQVYKMAIKKI